MSTEQNKSNKPVKDMSGYIARNEDRASDRHPHWRGKVRIEGKEYLLALWEKDDNSNLMSLSATDPEKLAKKLNNQQNQNQNNNPSNQSYNQNTNQNQNNNNNLNLGDGSPGDPFGDLFGSLPGD